MATGGQTGLYRVLGDADLLLYIGISNNFGRRWTEHARKQPWWNERRRMTVDWYDDRDEALDAEALAIFDEQPKYNVMHRKQVQRLRVIHGGLPQCGRSRGSGSAQLCRELGLIPQELTSAERRAAAGIIRQRTSHPDWAENVEKNKCLSCHAEPGELCRTKIGRLTYYHSIRMARMVRPVDLSRRVPADYEAIV